MFERLSNSWELVKASARVLSADKALLIFPLLSGLALTALAASFALPLLVTHAADHAFHGGAAALLGGLFYLASSFIIVFSNSALVGAALIRLEGGEPTVGDGFRVAGERLGAILGYSLIAATVGMVLHSLQEKAGFLGRLVVGLLGMAWGLATFLVIPVLVSENLGPADAVKRSMELLRETWGEQLVGNFAVSSVTGLVVALLFIGFGPVIGIALAHGAVSTAVLAGAGLLGGLLLVTLVSSALSGIYTAAVYRFATEGEVGETFSSELIVSAFRPRGS